MAIEFTFPSLDSTTADAINAYSLEMLSEEKDFDRFSSLREIGVGKAPDFAVHAVTLKVVEAYRRQGRIADWIRDFNISFSADRNRKYKYEDPLVPFSQYEKMGLFIPEARKKDRGANNYDPEFFGTKDATALFNGHMVNYANEDGNWQQTITAFGVQVKYPFVITGRNWSPYDFNNEELIRLARTRFIPGLWKGLKQYAQADRYSRNPDPVSSNLSDLLVAYYLKISDLCSTDE